MRLVAGCAYVFIYSCFTDYFRFKRNSNLSEKIKNMTYTTQIKVLVIVLFHTEDYTVPTIYIVYLRKYVLILKYYKN